MRPPSPPFCWEKATHLKVDGIHAKFVGVQVAELGKGSRHVVQVVDSFGERVDHLLAVSLEIAGARAQVEVGEVGLGGWVRCEHPAGKGRAKGSPGAAASPGRASRKPQVGKKGGLTW